LNRIESKNQFVFFFFFFILVFMVDLIELILIVLMISFCPAGLMYPADCQFLSKEYAEYMEKTIRIAYTCHQILIK